MRKGLLQKTRQDNASRYAEEYGIIYYTIKGRYMVYHNTYHINVGGKKETCRFFINLDSLGNDGLPCFDHKEILSFVKHKNNNPL